MEMNKFVLKLKHNLKIHNAEITGATAESGGQDGRERNSHPRQRYFREASSR